MPRGGHREGAGRKKGPVRLEKEAARELVRRLVTAQLGPMVRAQIANCRGLKYLVTRDKKTGKFIRVTEAMARAKQGSDEETIEVWEKDPNVYAFTDLMNRALDKPKEQPQEHQVTGALDIVTILQARHARHSSKD
jgi:hypothetical protein